MGKNNTYKIYWSGGDAILLRVKGLRVGLRNRSNQGSER